MTAASQTHLVSAVALGLPESGKTTFLGALWVLVRDAAPKDSLRMEGPLPTNTAYLDDAAFSYLGGEPVPRTNYGTGEDVSLSLAVDDRPFAFRHVDVSGESIRETLRSRRIPKMLRDRIQNAGAILLFIDTRQVVVQESLTARRRLLRLVGEATDDDDGVADVSDPREADDDDIRSAMATELQLIDLLQIVHDIRGEVATSTRVAVVLSAWDTVDPDAEPGSEPKEIPEEWLAGAMPQLAQFVRTNSHTLPSKVFGLSAQGGSYADEIVAKRLAQTPPTERILTVEGGAVSRDLAAPFRWILTAPEHSDPST